MDGSSGSPPPAARTRVAWLWQAHPSVQGAARQRRARLAGAVLLCLLALSVVDLAVSLSGATGATSGDVGVIVGAVAGLLVAYLLVRRGHVTAGALVALALMEAAIWAWRVGAPDHTVGATTLYFLGIPLLVAGLLLPVRGAIAVSALTLACALAVEPALDHRSGAGLDAEDASLAIFLLAIGTLAVAASAMGQRDARLLDESTAQMRQLAENIPEVFFILSPDLRIPLYISPAYEHIWGRRAEQFMADPSDWLKAVHPEDHGRVMAALQATPFGTMEYRIVQPGGAVRHIRSQTFPVHDGKGAVIRMVGVAEDITEAKLAAERLREANGRLEAAAEERQRMFRQVAHDLANPLSPIALHLALLGRAELAEKPRHSVAVIQRNVEQMRRHVEDLRDLARIEGGRLRLEMARVDVAALVAEAAESFQEEAEGRGVRLAVQATGPLVASADRGRLGQVLYNLLTNALKFTPAGGTVAVRARADGGQMQVSVQDSGRGLAPDEAARLFQPFSQVHAPGEVKERGTGLGLFICKGIVEAHGGRVWVDSEGKGKGSTFTFQVPAAPAGGPGEFGEVK